MKARQLNTLEAFLKEYGGTVKAGTKPTGPIPSGEQPHDNADKEKAQRDQEQTPNQDTNADVRAQADAGLYTDDAISSTTQNSTQATSVKASPEVNAPTGAGKNISKVQTSGSPTTGKGSNQAVGESEKLKRFKPRGAFGRSSVGSILKKKLPTGKLLKEADPLDFIVEINFNNKEVVKKALNGPVNCGFEAEFIFPDIPEFNADDDYYGDSTIEQIANSDHEEEIRDLYRKTLLDYDNAYGEAFFEFQMDQMRRDFEDEDWLNDFVDDVIGDDEVEEYKKEKLADLDKDDDEYEERVDWEDDAWGRELAELRYQDEMQDYWMELIDDYKLERLIFRFEDNTRYGIDSWMEDSGESGNEYWSEAHDLLASEERYGQDGSSKERAYEEVESWLFDWAKMNSHNADIRVGGYHETTGHDGWRIEEDGSLSGDGQGFEVISPVFDTPKEMLAEIKSLFEYAQGDVDTNRTTGLHITMSYAEESSVPANIAKTKMYVLSGADNQAKVWGREFNTYSQNTKIQVLKALRAIATGNASQDNIKTMDDMIEKFNASSESNKIERQSTVNIKRQTNAEGNNLIEFRAAGGPTYIDDFGQVAKDVTRYSATIVASYDPEAYNKEFAKKMYKWLQDASDVKDPNEYSATRGLSPQDVYRQSTGDTTFDVDNHPLTNFMIKFTHSTFEDNIKQALTRFFTSLKNQQEYAAKHNLNEYEYKEDPQEVYADFKFTTAEALTDLLGYLALSPKTDKMTTKEVMAIRKLIKEHGINQEEFLHALKRDVGNPRLIPDLRDRADRTRIFKRASRLIGKDLMGDAPEPMAIFIAPSQVALITADGVRYMQQYGETDDAYLPVSKSDYAYMKTELDHLNQEFKRSQQNPDDMELDTAVRKMAFDLTKTFNNRINKDLDVERVAMRNSDGGLQYALMWQNQIARPHTDPLPAQQLKQLGVEVKPTEEKEPPFESLMSKFESKSLVEQLNILNKLDKSKIDEAHKKMFTMEEGVPDSRKATVITKLLSEHFPAGDLQKQMEAFSALPMPDMIDDFRAVRRQSGDDGCCRPVLCKYLKFLHPTLLKKVDSSFCDGGKDACNESVTEKWAGDVKIRKTGKWAGKTIAELQKRANALRKKETRTDSESSELKQINFAIRSKRDWKGDTKENKHFDEARLNSARTDKYLPIVQQIIDQGDATFNIGEKGDEGVFVADKGQKVVNRLTSLKGTLNGEPAEIKVNQIFKTPQMVAMAQGKDPNAVSASASKESYEIKPSQIFTDETFNATKVFDEVIKNPVLQQSEIGQHIIKMAKEIKNGQQPNINDTPKEFHTAIRDYAGEYLGVLALIRGTANFPTRDAWLKHLGVSSLDEILINFPKESNFALGDSIGSFENSKTGNQILISSKGGKKGAPPSLNGLKIPDELKTVPAYANEIDVIEALQGSSGIAQPFVGLNKIFEYNPESINQAVRKLLPFTEKDILNITKLIDGKLYDKSDINKLPAKFKPLLKLINLDRVNPRATPGGIIHYTLNKVLVDAVNNNNAMPNFEPLAREILQKNFIQIFARPKGGVLGFDVLWPSKDLATGKIELYSKASSTEPGKQKMSFSVT